MSEGRSLTLRKKRKERPVISSPKLLSGPSAPRSTSQSQEQSEQAAAQLEKQESRDKDRNGPSDTADLVKRRYSTRYNQLPDFSNLDAPPVPTLPTLPTLPSLPGVGGAAGSTALKRSSKGGAPRRRSRDSGVYVIKVDQEALADPNLQHERYVTELLANASAQDIQEYQTGLRRMKNRTSAHLQQSVYQNRTQFIKISKEAEKLKSEMQVLRGLMADLTRALQTTDSSSSLSSAGGASAAASSSDASALSLARRHNHRSSVANLESMWNVQLQSLWKTVEKSQKFLPAIPGRHVIMENGAWIELDAATWKPKRPVHVVLLNDHLLIASKKRKRLDPNVPQKGPAPTKLVAEECFALPDIDVVDMSNATNAIPSTASEEKTLQSAFTIRSGGRSLTYRHEKRDAAAKANFLQTFRKAAEDLRKASKIDTKKASAQTESLNYFASRDPASAHNADILSSLSSTASKAPDMLVEVDGKQQNFRWVEAQIDELDIDIALQRFDEAVAKVEKLRRVARTSLHGNGLAQELIRVKVDERAAQLANILCRDLVDTPAFLDATRRTISHLSRLGAQDRARQAYLSARSDALTSRARQCLFEGDLHRYIFSISYVYFTMIRNTVLIYQASFSPPAATMSAVVAWANHHLERFNELLQRQLSTVDRNGGVWRECMDLVWEHERTVLGSEGLDFSQAVGRGLELRPETAAAAS